MSNVLKVSIQTTIYSLADRGWSQRRIARELEVDRETIGRHLRLRPKPAISITGSEPGCESKPANALVGPEAGGEPKPAISIPGTSAGRKSGCESVAAAIKAKVEAGLTAQRIYQDLVLEGDFAKSYQSVQRFVRKLKETQPERVWRIECQPGEEAQVDFGVGAPIYETPTSKARKTWVLRVILSWSRKGYSEVVTRQDTETFLRALENAFRHFRGVPLTLNVDNLKAAVLKADWFDPVINPKLTEFCRHYGTHVMPCRPWTPQHKGKVERGIAYVKSNALKGRRFSSVAEQNSFLEQWESATADKRIHGTTRKQVAACFEEERPHLLPLPNSLFPAYQEAQRTVSRDSFIEVQKAYYEAPPELIGRQVWARWDSRCVRILNDRLEQVAMHTRIEPGKFSRTLGIAGFSGPVRSSCRYWISRAAVLGDNCGQWAQAAVDARGPEALRSVMALCGLIHQHSGTALDKACAKALCNGTHRIKDVRRLIGEQAEQTQLCFVESHPLIRPLQAYSDFIDNHNHNHQAESYDHQHPQTTCPHPSPIRAA